jgi:phage terminase large subunit-like protein
MAAQARSGPRKSKAPARSSKKKRPDGGKAKLASAKLNQEGRNLLAMFHGQPADPKERERKRLDLVARATVRSRVLEARGDPNKLIEYCFKDSETGKPLVQADIHRELQAAMSSGEDCVNLFPRDHGKTTQTEGHIIWVLGNNPNLRIKIVCASDSKAVERLFAIIQHIRINDCVHDVFPWLKPAKLGDWTKHKIVVERDYISRDASIEALGVLSTATGGRADKLYADDVVDRRNALELPKLRETVKSAWDSDWSNLLEPEAQSVYNATPWHTADLTHKLLRNPTYKVLRREVGTADDPYAPVWDEKWPREALMRRRLKIGQLEYDRGFRLRALSGEFATVREEWIDYWDEPPDLGKLIVFQAFDVSSGTAKDYFAAVTLGVDPKSLRIYVLEGWHAKLTFLARAQAIEQQARTWRPSLQGLEEETMKSLSQYLGATSLLNVLSLRPHLAKAIRLMSVTPHLETGRVLFNPALKPDRIANREEHGDLVSELLEFPLGANDDLVDAFVYALQLATTYGLEDEDDGLELGIHVIGGGGNDDLLDTGEGGGTV